MGKFRKIIATTVAAVMALTLLVTPFASAAKLPEDVIGTKYEEAVELLNALDIMVGDEETGDFRLEDTIIRSEFAKIAVLMSGLGDVADASSDKTPFPDVVDNHWATGYINVAAAQKFIIGDDTGDFRPDEPITYGEAVTILVRVLGYEPSALSNGSYPTGYIVTAADIGLLSGGVTASSADAQASRGMVAQMSFNALTINLMEKTGFGSNERYEVTDKTLLENKLKVTKHFGQVVANNQTTLNGLSNLRNDEVQIKVDEETNNYKVGNTDAASFIAKNVIFYVKNSQSTTDKTILLIRDNGSKNNEVTVTSNNIHSISGDPGSPRTFKYWDESISSKNPQTLTISSTAKVFYNGVVNSEYDLDDLADLKSGNVRFLDTENSDQYSYVFVTEYQNLVVSEVSLAGYTVKDKYDNFSLTLDPSNKSIKFTMKDTDGNDVALADLKEWDVLSVAMNDKTASDATVLNIVVVRDSVVGKVEEIEDDMRIINGQKFEIAANYTDSSQPEIQLDDEGTFYLDIDGRIAAVDTTSKAASNYAYFVKAAETGSIDKKVEFQLFTKDGETVVLNGASKMKLDETANKTAKEVMDSLNNKQQLISYEVNSKGEIYYIDTATDGDGVPNTKAFTKDIDGSVKYNSTTKKLGNATLTKDTLVLEIPEDATDPEDFTVRTMDMFVDKNDYTVEIFDLSDDYKASVVIVRNSKSVANAEAPILIVEKITSAQNADKTPIDKVYGYENGQRVEYAAKDAATLVKGEHGDSKLETGDIIQYALNSKGEIESINVLFDASKRSEDIEGYTKHEGTEMETLIGKVTKKFADSINVTVEDDNETNLNISNAVVYNYDYSKPSASQVTVVDSSQISKYDEADPRLVFIRIYQGEVKEIVIIKK